jgi:AmmeMemoRadiSam system protein B/AmmeMemoRadiSam system protein A
VAGQFYSDDAGKLEEGIRAYLAAAVPADGVRPLALVAPHAGYIFSGQICADAYRQAMDHEYDLVVILGTNHTTAGFTGVSVYPGTGYRTPLGLAVIDQQVATALLAADRSFTFRPDVHEREHSVEVQVPYVQVVFPGAKIVTAVVGQPDPDLCTRFGRALARVLQGRRALLVASTDLSHYPEYKDAQAADWAVLEAVAGLDPDEVRAAIKEQMRRGYRELRTCACGEAPLLALLTAAHELGATRGRVISYANSGDAVIGERQRVVGYGAVALAAGPAGTLTEVLRRPEVAPHDQQLTAETKRDLLALARETIRRFLETETTPLARDCAPVLNRQQGAFVTLKKHGQLRGCIGHMAEDRPLCQVVGAMAYQAAFKDRRFSPLRSGELAEVEIEISVLTPFTKVPGPDAIVIGRDGVVLRKSGRSAVYLPQVATEQGWSREEMLDHLCQKAGLAVGSWRRGAELFTFQAEVFHESEFD